jgi:serine protease Do
MWWAPMALVAAGAALGAGGSAALQPKLPPPTQAELNDAERVGRTFARVASQVGPSVVRITVTSRVDRTGGGGGEDEDNPFKGTPFEKFFEFDQKGRPRVERRQGMGSGVVLDKNGYILTNNHVVEKAESVKVTFVDGKQVQAKVIGTDPKSDLAVVKVDGVEVTPAKLGDPEQSQVGDWVIAIGNPFGLDHTVTVGVLSAKNRSGFVGGNYEDFLQTDASINPGNSGGPLVNLQGEVIGINSMIAGIGTGIGFAVPVNMARPIVKQLIEHGKVSRPWLGIMMQNETPELQKSLGGHPPESGALVSEVQAGSPAEKAGVKAGDIITEVDHQRAKTSRDVQRQVLEKKIGDRVALTVWRDGRTQELEITTATLPEKNDNERGSRATKQELGMELGNLTPDLAQRLDLPSSTKGAVITDVDSGSAAALAGLESGDVLVEVDHKPVASADEAAQRLGEKRDGGHLLRVRRGSGALFLVLPPA